MIEESLLEEIVNKQFEIAGESIRANQIPDDDMIEVGKKKIYWYYHYKFQNEAQWLEWRKWAEDRLREEGIKKVETELNQIDLIYGMAIHIPKEGQLF